MDNIAQDGTGEIQYTRGSVDLLTLFASFASGSGSSQENALADDPLAEDLEAPMGVE
jgi:phospholipid/cholesterol/gamma-HCH transport system substrate-binding protein